MSESKAAVATVQAENELTRVTEWRFAPGATTGYHIHEHDYVIVPLDTGQLLLTGLDGEHTAELVAGASYYCEAGDEHDVKNINDHEVAFIEIEFKSTSIAK